MYQKSYLFLSGSSLKINLLAKTPPVCYLDRITEHGRFKSQTTVQACGFPYHWSSVLNLIVFQQNVIFLLNEEELSKENHISASSQFHRLVGLQSQPAICFSCVVVLSCCFSGWVNYSLVFYRTYFKADPDSEIRYCKKINLWSKSKILRCMKKNQHKWSG